VRRGELGELVIVGISDTITGEKALLLGVVEL
jgi:hypothetical protein